MALRALKAIGVFGLGTALTVLGAALIVTLAILMGWPPLAARSAEVGFTVADQPGRPNSGRAAMLDFAESHSFKLLGEREEVLNPDTLGFHHFFRWDSHIFMGRGFEPGEFTVSFRRSTVPMSRSAEDVQLLAEQFRQDMTSAGFAVEAMPMD